MNDLLLCAKGNPDNFKLYYRNIELGDCAFFNKGAIPFMLVGNELYIGEESKSHGSIICHFFGMTEDEYNKKMDEAFENENFDDLKRLGELWEMAMKKLERNENCVNGRIFLNIKVNNNKVAFNYAILSFWGGKYNNHETIDGRLVNELLAKYGLSPNKVLVVNFENGATGTLIPYTKWGFYVPPMDEYQQKAYALHLMNAKQKYDATFLFRNERDKNRGRKLTNDKGIEMTDAQYRSIIYPYESIKKYKRIIREEISKLLNNENY